MTFTTKCVFYENQSTSTALLFNASNYVVGFIQMLVLANEFGMNWKSWSITSKKFLFRVIRSLIVLMPKEGLLMAEIKTTKAK